MNKFVFLITTLLPLSIINPPHFDFHKTTLETTITKMGGYGDYVFGIGADGHNRSLFRSEDAENFKAVSPKSGDISGFGIDKLNHIGVGSCDTASKVSNALYMSTQNGDDFTLVNLPGAFADIQFNSIYVDPSNGYIGVSTANYGLYLSKDNGQNFSQVHPEFKDVYVYYADTFDGKNVLILKTNYSKPDAVLYKSYDFGNTLKELTDFGGIPTIHNFVSGNNVLFASSEEGLLSASSSDLQFNYDKNGNKISPVSWLAANNQYLFVGTKTAGLGAGIGEKNYNFFQVNVDEQNIFCVDYLGTDAQQRIGMSFNNSLGGANPNK